MTYVYIIIAIIVLVAIYLIVRKSNEKKKFVPSNFPCHPCSEPQSHGCQCEPRTTEPSAETDSTRRKGSR